MGVGSTRGLPAESDADVWGVLYLLTADQQAHLDRTEGVPSGLYRRIRVDIETEGRHARRPRPISASRRDPSRLPSHRYRSILLEGAHEHGLPEQWVATLESWSMAWDEREGATNPPGPARPD